MGKWDDLNGVQQALLEDILDEPTRLFYHSQFRVVDELIELGYAAKIAYDTYVATSLGRQVFRENLAPAEAPLPAATEAVRAGEGDTASELTALGYELARYGASTEDKAAAVAKYIERHTEAQAARIRELEAALAFAKSELSKIPAPITQTRYATEIINSVWVTVAEALETAHTADGAAGGDV